MTIADRLTELGLTLPAPMTPPPGRTVPPTWVRVIGTRVVVSGHGPQLPDGSPAPPFGRVPDQVSVEQAEASARLVALSIMATVQRAVGELDRVEFWVSAWGFVQAAPNYEHTTRVMNAFSDTVVAVFGEQIGAHARTAIGAATLPLNVPVIAAAELQLRS